MRCTKIIKVRTQIFKINFQKNILKGFNPLKLLKNKKK